jgi:hypothetical protein
MTDHPTSNRGKQPSRPSDHRAGTRGETGSPRGKQGRDRIALQREIDALARRRRRTRLVSATVAVLVVVTGIVVAVTQSGSSPGVPGATHPVSGPPGPEGVPLEEGALLAPVSSAANGRTVDGIQCNAGEQVAFHVHTHLSVMVDGRLRPIPAGIGIVSPVAQPTAEGAFDQASQCYYWLHVHAQDGIIHIESPAGHRYTLGDFFDLWGQPLTTDQVGPATGALTMFVNGKRYLGDPRSIGLGSHEDIQIDVGAPVVTPQGVDWSQTKL